jgi:hypothetical protein
LGGISLSITGGQMSDLVKRLRDGVAYDPNGYELSEANQIMEKSAARIEALEAALRQAREALTRSYNVVKWPVDGETVKYAAIAAINDLLKD